MLKKTLALVLVFMLCFSISVNAMTLSIPKEEYYENMTYSNAEFPDENCGFLYKLISIGVIENFEFDNELSDNVILDIVKKAFNVNKLEAEFSFDKNQELVKILCETLNIAPANEIKNIRRYLDYGLIDKDYLPYYESFASLGYINDNINFLRPDKPITYKSFLNILSGLENEIYNANGVRVISGKIEKISFANNTKTINIITDDYEVDIPLREGRKTVWLDNGVAGFESGAKIGNYVNLIVNKDNQVVLIENASDIIEKLPNVEGIYKAKIYLYDYINGKVIFNELKKYNGEEFVSLGGKYTEIKVSDNVLLYGYYIKTNGYHINKKYLDINAYFITDTNLQGEEEIIYLNVLN